MHSPRRGRTRHSLPTSTRATPTVATSTRTSTAPRSSSTSVRRSARPSASSPLLHAPRSLTSRTSTTVPSASARASTPAPSPSSTTGASITCRPTPLTWRAPESSLPPWRPSRRPCSDQEWSAEFKSHAEFKVEERAGSPPQVAPKCCRAKLSKLSCLLDCSVSLLLRCQD